jgi:hypothetical protein
MAVAGWAMVGWTLLPAYAPPRPLAAGAAEVENRAGTVFDRRIELVGYNGPQAAVAGEPLRVALCWRALAPVAENYTLFLEVVGADNQGYGRLQTYPGRGNYPTAAWAVNEPFCDGYTVEVGAGIPAPALARLRVAWLDSETGQPLPAETPEAGPLPEPEFHLPFKVTAPEGHDPPIDNPVDYAFGGTTREGALLRLTGWALAPALGGVKVTLRWEPLAPLPDRLVVMVHLRDSPDSLYASGDSPPLDGGYPTGRWALGEIVMDPHIIPLPGAAGERPAVDLYVGLYDEAGQRLAVFDAAGDAVPNHEVVLERGIRP